MRRFLYLAAGAVFVLGLFALLRSGGTAQAADAQAAAGYEDVRVGRRDIVRTATVRGRLEASDSLKFGPPPVQSQWQFKISFLAPEGEDIEQGAPLVAFDTTELARRVLEAQSALATAQTQWERERSNSKLAGERRQLELAEALAEVEKLELKADVPEDVTASRELNKTRLEVAQARSKADHLSAKSELESRRSRELMAHLRSQVEEKTATLEQLLQEVDSMTIRAPSGGTVVYETNWRNEKKKVGDQTHRMEKVLSLPDLSRLRATASVDEAYAALVSPGQPVTFVLDAFPEQQYRGTIANVNPAVKQRSWRDRRKVVFVGIDLDDPDIGRMRPGMRFQGKLEVARLADTLAVPMRCIEATDGGPAVRVKKLLGEALQPLTLGDFGEDWIAVLDGLEDGDSLRCPVEGS